MRCGEPIRGKRQINEYEAKIVLRIFKEYADGPSSRTIAKRLNEGKIPGPRGNPWSDYSIHGNRRRVTGILNNELYIGRLVWNRQKFVKDPDNGKRQARPNPPSDWLVQEVPDLRIIDGGLWGRSRDRQGKLKFKEGSMARGGELNKRHRSRYLLSGLMKCGLCHCNYIIVGADRYGCGTRRTKATCANSHILNRKEIEALILDGLKEKLLAPEFVEVFIAEFNAEVARKTSEGRNDRQILEAEFRELRKKLTAIISAIEQGVLTETTRDRLLELEARQSVLEETLSKPEPAPYPSIHPNLVALYKRKVAALEEALSTPELQPKAGEILRSMIDRIEIMPRSNTTGKTDRHNTDETAKDENGVSITLFGELAAIVDLAEENGAIENKRRVLWQSGARNQRYLQLNEVWL